MHSEVLGINKFLNRSCITFAFLQWERYNKIVAQNSSTVQKKKKVFSNS